MRFLIIPGIIAAFSLAVIWAAFQLELSPAMIVGHSMQPRVFPIFLMIINLVLAACLAFLHREPHPHKTQFGDSRTWGSIFLFVIFYVITIYIDMLIAIAVVVFAMSILWGERRIHVAATLAVATPVTIFLLFDLVLSIRFPRGLFTNWYYG